jgi:hypothetical protein
MIALVMRALGLICSLSVLWSVSPAADAQVGVGRSADKTVTVFLKLVDDPVAVVRSRQPGRQLGADEERALVLSLRRRQDALVPLIQAQGGTVLARVQYAMNAIKVQAPAGRLESLSRLPGVTAVVHISPSEPLPALQRPPLSKP